MILGACFSPGLGCWNWAGVDAVDVGGIGRLRAFETAGDDASAIANIEECIWVGDGGVDDAVVSKGDEGEMLVVETGVFCWARGQEVVSNWFQRLWSNGGDRLTGE